MTTTTSSAPVTHAMTSYFGRALCGPATSITRYASAVTCPTCRAAMARGERWLNVETEKPSCKAPEWTCFLRGTDGLCYGCRDTRIDSGCESSDRIAYTAGF